MKNRLLLVGIGVMLIASSLIASYTPINWFYFSISAIVMAILIYLQKKELKKNLSVEGDNQLSLTHFEETLNKLLDELTQISESEIDDNYRENLLLKMENLLPNIDDYRIVMINQLGVANYTNISIPYAKAERLINRGVSAAIDDYLNESKKNIVASLEFIKTTISDIEKIKAENYVK